jgi:type II secretory pathway predicted ATPase ExeA
VLKNSVEEGVAPEDVITDAAATRLATKLKTPLQIGQHLVRAFEAAFEIGAKPVDENVVEAALSLLWRASSKPLFQLGPPLAQLN